MSVTTNGVPATWVEFPDETGERWNAYHIDSIVAVIDQSGPVDDDDDNSAELQIRAMVIVNAPAWDPYLMGWVKASQADVLDFLLRARSSLWPTPVARFSPNRGKNVLPR